MSFDTILAGTKWRIVVAFTAIAAFFAAVIMTIGTCTLGTQIKKYRDAQEEERKDDAATKAELLRNDATLLANDAVIQEQFRLLRKGNPEISVPVPIDEMGGNRAEARVLEILPKVTPTPKPTPKPKVITRTRYKSRPTPTPFKLFRR